MKLRLQLKRDEAPGVMTFILKPMEPISWQPGQYMHYDFQHPNADTRGFERYFTIASAPYENYIQITTRFDGEMVSSFKQALRDMPEGSEVTADGPRGKFILESGDHHHILIAGGIGITPYRSMLLQLAHDNMPLKISLLYANRDKNFVFADELIKSQLSNPNFQLIKFQDKRITEQDLQAYRQEADSIFYLSGPRAMVEAYEDILTSKGLGEDRVRTDYFPGY
jgi:ferredoxin-NADP reductase